MLTLKKETSSKLVCPNLLPCGIRHDGPVPISDQHWKPTANTDDTRTAYFRGRKLFGKAVTIPAGYKGVLLSKTAEEIKPTSNKAFQLPEEEEESNVAEVPEVAVEVARTQAVFDKVTVWGHEVVPAQDDQHVKAIQEWISFAVAMHSFDDPEGS